MYKKNLFLYIRKDNERKKERKKIVSKNKPKTR